MIWHIFLSPIEFSEKKGPLSSSFFLQEKLVATMSREELDLASCPEDAVSDMTKNRVSLFVGLTHTMADSITILCKPKAKFVYVSVLVVLTFFLPRRTRTHVHCLRARRANVRKNEDNYSRLLLLISF